MWRVRNYLKQIETDVYFGMHARSEFVFKQERIFEKNILLLGAYVCQICEGTCSLSSLVDSWGLGGIGPNLPALGQSKAVKFTRQCPEELRIEECSKCLSQIVFVLIL